MCASLPLGSPGDRQGTAFCCLTNDPFEPWGPCFHHSFPMFLNMISRKPVWSPKDLISLLSKTVIPADVDWISGFWEMLPWVFLQDTECHVALTHFQRSALLSHSLARYTTSGLRDGQKSRFTASCIFLAFFPLHIDYQIICLYQSALRDPSTHGGLKPPWRN